MSARTGQPVLAGLVAPIVGFTSSFAIVIAGLRAVGADADQAASGLLALCLAMGVVALWLSLHYRMPISVAWSTPGAALLISSGSPTGGWSAAVGAFLVCGLLLAVTGLWGRLGRWIAAIPAPLAAAMLAGVLLPICVAPARAVVELPWQALPVVLTWAVLLRFARRWAVPVSFLVTVAVILIDGPPVLHGSDAVPVLELTAPTFEPAALIGLALPLFVVTMASQNVTGLTVLGSFGYRPPLRPVLGSTGAATMVVAPFGGHAINLAAITAALIAGPDAGPDTRRRWIGGAVSGLAYFVLGLTAGLVTSFVEAAPDLLVEAFAGLALVGALAAALTTALGDERYREAAAVTFVVSASGISPAGISASFWGLTAGLAFLGLQRAGR